MDESEKDFKKMTERVTETTEAMKVKKPLLLCFLNHKVTSSILLLMVISPVLYVWCSDSLGLSYCLQETYTEFMAEAQATASRGMFKYLIVFIYCLCDRPTVVLKLKKTI